MQLENLWKDHQNSIRGFLHARISNPSDVEDLLQEILIKAYKNLDSLSDSDKVKPWLFRIASNTVIDFYRRRKAVHEPLNPDQLQISEEVLTQAELSHCITPFIRALPRENAELLLAIDIEGQSQKEFAERRGIPYSTLKSRLGKSRRMLRKLYEDCCQFSFDRFGQVIDYQPKDPQRYKC